MMHCVQITVPGFFFSFPHNGTSQGSSTDQSEHRLQISVKTRSKPVLRLSEAAAQPTVHPAERIRAFSSFIVSKKKARKKKLAAVRAAGKFLLVSYLHSSCKLELWRMQPN